MRSDNDVSGNETDILETSETLEDLENEAVEVSNTESTVMVDSNDYTVYMADVRGLLILEIVVLIAIGCIVAWTGAHHE